MKNEEKIINIAYHYGLEKQINVAIEEMAELTKELCKHLRNKNNYSQIAEEIVDVEIMIQQLKILFAIKDKDLNKIKTQKIERQLRRIENGI